MKLDIEKRIECYNNMDKPNRIDEVQFSYIVFLLSFGLA